MGMARNITSNEKQRPEFQDYSTQSGSLLKWKVKYRVPQKKEG